MRVSTFAVLFLVLVAAPEPSRAAQIGVGFSVVEAYSDQGGTFWANATTGTDPYRDLRGSASWDLSFIKDGEERAIFEVTGATLELFDGGSGRPEDLFAGFEMIFAILGNAQVIINAEISGRAGSFTESRGGEISPPGIAEAEAFSSGGETFGGLGYRFQVRPFTVSFDLSSFEDGDLVSLVALLDVTVTGAGGETSASAFARDPASLERGIRYVGVPEPRIALLLALGLAAGRTASRRTRGGLR